MQNLGRTTVHDVADPDEALSTADAGSDPFEKGAIDFFAASLADLGRVFGGDLRAAAIFVLLAREALVNEPGSGMTQSELAAESGIPRETVRRKLAAMERLGWVGRRDTVWYLDARRGEAGGGAAFLALRARFAQRAAALAEAAKTAGRG